MRFWAFNLQAELVGGGYAPTRGDMLLAQKDRGGDEYFQLYALANGRLTLLTDGKSRNELNAWANDGTLLGLSSTRRNGADSDLYVMDPRLLLARVNEITKPMFVIAGANDPRVPKSEADQMVAAIRENGGEAWHMVAADEGHGYRKRANQDYGFLAQLPSGKNTFFREESSAALHCPK